MIEEHKNLFQEIFANAQKRCSIKLSENNELVVSIVQGLYKNYEKHNYPLCPCRPKHIALEDPQGFSCPCKYLESDITEKGHCTCKLFIRDDTMDFPHVELNTGLIGNDLKVKVDGVELSFVAKAAYESKADAFNEFKLSLLAAPTKIEGDGIVVASLLDGKRYRFLKIIEEEPMSEVELKELRKQYHNKVKNNNFY